MSNSTQWDVVIKSHILTIHPDRNKPAEDLQKRRQDRKSNARFWTILSICGGFGTWIFIAILTHAASVKVMSPQAAILMPITAGVGFSLGLLLLGWRTFTVPGGNYEDYSKIKASLDVVDKLLFKTEGEIYDDLTTVTSAQNSAGLLLYQKTRLYLYYEQRANKVIAFTEGLSTSLDVDDPDVDPRELTRFLLENEHAAIADSEIVIAIKALVNKHREEFKDLHAKLRAVGLSEEKWDFYFDQQF